MRMNRVVCANDSLFSSVLCNCPVPCLSILLRSNSQLLDHDGHIVVGKNYYLQLLHNHLENSSDGSSVMFGDSI